MVSQGIRIRFRKVGKMQFISHLDLCRTMRSALVRSRLPVKYTEGFNPHIKMTFALPLSIGAQSEWEYMDLTLTQPCEPSELLARLGAQLPSELAPLCVDTPKYTYAQIGWAEYQLTFSPTQTSVEAVKELFSAPILSNKRTKRGEKEVDLLQSVRTWSVTQTEAGVVLCVLLQADNAGYLNPEYLAKAVGAQEYSILRTGVFLADGTTPFA